MHFFLRIIQNFISILIILRQIVKIDSPVIMAVSFFCRPPEMIFVKQLQFHASICFMHLTVKIQINVRAVAFFETIMILPLLVEDYLLRSAEFVSQIKMLLVFCVGISYLILTGSKGSVFCCDPGLF